MSKKSAMVRLIKGKIQKQEFLLSMEKSSFIRNQIRVKIEQLKVDLRTYENEFVGTSVLADIFGIMLGAVLVGVVDGLSTDSAKIH